MTKLELKRIIKEEITKILNEDNKPTLIKEGYTHYYYSPRGFKPFSDDDWRDICETTASIIKQAERDGIVICDAGGTPGSTAEINRDEIAFNGDGSEGLDHETFLITKRKGGDFTKTARKPYDAVVVSVLAYINEMYPGKLDIDSDGNGVFDNPPYRP